MSTLEDAVSGSPRGVILSVEVSAGSKQDRFPAGYNPWRNTILCRVTDPARDGKANAAVLALIGDVLEVPACSLRIQSGTTASLKKILVAGRTKPDILQRLSSRLS